MNVNFSMRTLNLTRRSASWLALVLFALACTDDARTPRVATEVAVDGAILNFAEVTSGHFQQCQNDNPGPACKWINGVLNAAHSEYAEDEVIPERFVIPNLVVGRSYELVFDWGWEKAQNPGHMNYDFLAGWDATEGANAGPCFDLPSEADYLSVCGTSGDILASHSGANADAENIPDAIFTTNAPLGLSAELQAALTRFKTLRGANAIRFDILGGSFPATPFSNATYTVSGDNVTGRFTVRFTAGRSTIMLLWGGHFARTQDYNTALWDADKNAGTAETTGNLTGAAGQSGAPFHFTQQWIKDLTTNVVVGIGSLSNNVQGAVVVLQPKAKIELTPLTDVNAIGETHTVTVTVSEAPDAGAAYVPAAGETVTYSLVGSGGANPVENLASSTCDDQPTNASGQCVIVFTSQTAGTVTIHAASNVSVGGQTIAVATGTGGDNSADATKTFVAGTLRWLKHNTAGQLLGGAVFTVCRTHDYVSASNSFTDITPDVCIDVTDDTDGVDGPAGAGLDQDGTGGEFQLNGLILGRYTVTEKTPPAGGYNKDPDTETKDLTTAAPSGTIATAFVDPKPSAKITIETDDTNAIGESHTFTVTLQKNLDDGNGFVAAAGEHVSFTLTNAGGASYVLDATASTCDNAGANTNASGQCTIVFSSATAGTVTGHASASLTVGAVTLSVQTDGTAPNSDDAVKTYVDGSLVWYKNDNAGQRLGGATFEVCRTHNLNTATDPDSYTDITDVCVTVVDKTPANAGTYVGLDTDGDAGEFKLEDLILGKYTVRETVAPPGFLIDLATAVSAPDMTIAAPNVTIATAFTDTPAGRSQLTPTGTECSAFKAGTATTQAYLDAHRQGNTIGAVNPGVFIAWFEITLPAGTSALSVLQTQSPDSPNFPDFDVNGTEAWIYNFSCVKIADFTTINGGQVSTSFTAPSAGKYIIRVKYDPSSVTGTSLWNALPETYSFAAQVGGTTYTTASLILRQKP